MNLETQLISSSVHKLNLASFNAFWKSTAMIIDTFGHDSTSVCMYLYNATLYRLLLVDSDFPWDTKLSLDLFAKRSVSNPRTQLT